MRSVAATTSGGASFARRYNGRVSHLSESEDWIALHKVYKVNGDDNVRERRSSLLECNKKSP